MPEQYKEAFPAGTMVRVVGRAQLEQFMRTWNYHNKLQPAQLKYAGTVRRVEQVGFYHGGDPLYVLEGLPKYVWHEECLSSMSELQQG